MMVNKYLKADDLHWDEKEKRYVALNDEEVEKVISSFILDADGLPKVGMNEDDVEQAVHWATTSRVNHLLLQGVLSGRIRMSVSEETGENLFYEVE